MQKPRQKPTKSRSLVHLGSRGVAHAVTKGGVELIGHKEVAVLEQHHGPMGAGDIHGNHRKPQNPKSAQDISRYFMIHVEKVSKL